MQPVDSRMNNSALGDGMNIEDIAALTSPTGASHGNRIAPDSGGERRRDIIEPTGFNQNSKKF